MTGCDSGLDATERARLRKDAQEADKKIAARARKDEGRWTLQVGGQVAHPAELPLADLQQQDAVTLTVPKNAVYPERSFKGVRISTIVDRAAPAADAGAAPTTVTLIGKDGYFATLALGDVRKHPFALVYEQDGAPMLPAFGGPLAMRFDPRAAGGELDRRYQYSDVSYVTHLIVGDEAASLRVKDRVFDNAALAKLPEKTVGGPVSYRSGWEATPQTLHGVPLRDVLHAAGLSEPLPRVQLFGKDELHQQKATAPTFAGDTFDSCEPLLVRSFGPDRTPVPTRRGGPLLLFVNAICREQLGTNAWLAFVERVEVR